MNRQNAAEQTEQQPLTQRELEVLSLIVEGLSNREIAERMVLALSTVKWYVRQIFNKLNVDSREEAVTRSHMLGLFLNAPEETKIKHNLPAQLSSFVGREREITEIRQLLKRSRFITLTGSGGTGKTRLGLEVAALIAGDYPDGVTLVSLASTTEPALVSNAIAAELGVLEQPNQALAATLQHYLANKKYLLVLDNYEHLLPSATLVTDLLRAAAQLTVLVTSREPLNISGEHEYLVPPLALPGQEDGAVESESVTLFVQRARMASNVFSMTGENRSTISGICLRLDGLPLAIELAAARIKLLSPHQMLERLDSRLGLLVGGPRDLPDRQRTLRDTIDWSFLLLDEDEQLLFTRLAVFSGGRTIDAVEHVCRSDTELRPLEGLESLLNKNLLYQEEDPGGEPRFYMLETIHEYARERLRAGGEQLLIRDQHLAYYLQLCERMEPGYLGHGQLLLIQQTEAEMDNIRSAFRWAMDSRQYEAASRLITAVNYYMRYNTQGVVEGYRLVRRLLAEQVELSPSHHVRFLIGAAELAFQNDDLERFRMLGDKAIRLARELGDEHQLAWALVQAVDFHEDGREYERAIHTGNDALTLFRKYDDQPGIAYVLNRLGEIFRLGGEIDRARQAYMESYAICIATGEVIREHILTANLGHIAYSEGDYEQALAIHLSLFRKRELIGWKNWTVTGLSEQAGPLAKLGEPQKAATMLSASAKLMAELGLAFHPYDQSTIEKYIADTRSLLDEQTFAEAWAAGQAMTYEQAVDYAAGVYL